MDKNGAARPLTTKLWTRLNARGWAKYPCTVARMAWRVVRRRLLWSTTASECLAAIGAVWLVVAVLLSGAARAQSAAEANAVHLEVFTRLARDYCLEFAGRKDQLVDRLVANNFTAHPQHALTFIREFGGVKYAVTVDEQRCTADVLLSSLADRGVAELFNANALIAKLTERMGLAVAKSESRTDQDSQGATTNVLWIRFEDQGRYITLSFPQENLSSYYMMFDVYRLSN